MKAVQGCGTSGMATPPADPAHPLWAWPMIPVRGRRSEATRRPDIDHSGPERGLPVSSELDSYQGSVHRAAALQDRASRVALHLSRASVTTRAASQSDTRRRPTRAEGNSRIGRRRPESLQSPFMARCCHGRSVRTRSRADSSRFPQHPLFRYRGAAARNVAAVIPSGRVAAKVAARPPCALPHGRCVWIRTFGRL
jgi:hypothetical protein